jgi:hypothetical protein
MSARRNLDSSFSSRVYCLARMGRIMGETGFSKARRESSAPRRLHDQPTALAEHLLLQSMANALGLEREEKIVFAALIEARSLEQTTQDLATLSFGIFDAPRSREDVAALIESVRSRCVEHFGWDPLQGPPGGVTGPL